MSTIYILKLESSKYYVGKTNNIEQRYKYHQNGTACQWTKLYPPVSILKTIENCSVFDEDKYVKEYMLIYGIDNVRGGSYVEEKLSDNQKEFIQRELWAASDCCTKCGSSDHFVSQCTSVKNFDDKIANLKTQIANLEKSKAENIQISKETSKAENIELLKNNIELLKDSKWLNRLKDQVRHNYSNPFLADQIQFFELLVNSISLLNLNMKK